MSFYYFEDYLKKYNENKKLYENKKLNKISDFLYCSESINNTQLLKNKSDIQIKYINLYETYLKQWLNINTSCINFYNEHINSLNEGLIMSYNYDIVINKFQKETQLSTVNIDFFKDTYDKNETKSIVIELYLDEYYKKEKLIKRFINKCGYFISVQKIYKEYNEIFLEIEPKYIVELTSPDPKFDLIYDKENDNIKNKCNGILYHMTLGAYYDKIKNIGLIPKAKNKKSNHPQRIYFYQSNKLGNNISKNMFINQALNFYKPDGKYTDSVKQFLKNGKLEIIILKIDLYKYQSLKYRFFQGPNHSQGIFTYEPVHPICVDLYTSFYI